MSGPVRGWGRARRIRGARWASVAVLGCVLTVVAAVPSRVAAEACTWPTITFRWGGEHLPGGADPDLRWENPSNWDRGRVPTAADRVCVPAWPHGTPEVHGDAVGGSIDASGTTITLRSGTLTVTESLAADTLVLEEGRLRGAGATDVRNLHLADPDALDLVADAE